MPDPTSNPPPKVTLEDLLRLKRHERPRPEFWSRFDQELRSRALRAFVHSAPSPVSWAHGWLARVVPWFTAGAAAALVLGLMVHGRIEQPAVFQPRASPAPAVATVLPAAVITNALSTNDILPRPAVETPLPALSEPVASTYAAATLSVAPGPAKFNKVPAMVSFTAENSTGVRYAVNTLDESMSARVSGTAY
jgi:hypothetical protein